ncbi:MAG: PKD domain-containing protein, partial [Chloroflexota bacterium]
MSILTNSRIFSVLICFIISAILLGGFTSVESSQAKMQGTPVHYINANLQAVSLTPDGFVDLSSWQKYEVTSGDANWVVEDDGNAVRQIDGTYWPTFFYSDETFANVLISGTIVTSDGDDFFGIVLGYNNPIDNPNTFEMVLWDWKRSGQPNYCNGASQEMALIQISDLVYNPSDECSLGSYFWNHSDSADFFNILDNNPGGWNVDTEYDFEIEYLDNSVSISINGVEQLTAAGTFKPGRIGFYNYALSDVLYKDLQVTSLDPLDVLDEATWNRSNSPAAGSALADGIPNALQLQTFPDQVWDQTENSRNHAYWSQSNSWDMHKFDTVFTLPSNFDPNQYQVTVRSKGFPNDIVAVNDNLYLFVNGIEIFRGGSSYSASRDIDLAPESDGWFVDGITISGLQSGDNVIEVLVEDINTWGALGELEFAVEPLGPAQPITHLSLSSNSPIEINRPANLVATVFGGGIVTYTWDMGDGTPVFTNTTGTVPDYQFASAGAYSVTVTVTNAIS